MTCASCQKRRERLLAWVRIQLGIDTILTNQGRFFQQHVDNLQLQINENVESIKTLGRTQLKIIEGLAEMEAQIESQDVATAALISSGTAELADRQESIRNSMRDVRMEFRKLKDAISDHDLELSSITERLGKLEMPGSEPLG